MNGRATSNCFWPRPPGPWGGAKGQISFNFNYKANFKDFIPNFMCVLTNKRYKTYQTGFASCRLDHASGVGLWGVGVPRGVKKIILWSCGISNRRV